MGLAAGDEAKIEFTYTSRQRTRERRTNSRHTRVKAAAVDRNLDGSVKVRRGAALFGGVRHGGRGTAAAMLLGVESSTCLLAPARACRAPLMHIMAPGS